MSETKKNNYDYIKELNRIVSSGEMQDALSRAEDMKKTCMAIMQEIKEKKASLGEEIVLKQREEAEKATELAKKAAEEADAARKELETATVTKEEPKQEEKEEAKEEAAAEKAKEEVLKKAQDEEERIKAEQQAKIEAENRAKAEEELKAKEEFARRQSEAAERARQRALEIEARLKKFYSENGREEKPANGGNVRKYENKNQGQNNRNKNNAANQTGGFNKDAEETKKPFAPKKQAPKNNDAVAFIPREPQKNFGNKNKTKQEAENKKVMTKRTLIRKGFVATDESDYEDRMGSKKIRPRKEKTTKTETVNAGPIKIERAVVTSDIIPIKTLSEKLGISATEITKKLFAEGIMKTVNESIDFDTAELIAIGYDIELILEKEKTAEEEMLGVSVEVDDDKDLVERPPVVTVMGHVDHGKTSLLDAIRHANVTSGEAGGITQHIGAYTVEINKRKITFIDTPGHEAFTAMRQRGAQITDIAILVVAGDDGIMPQTVEAINHIKAAGVEMIVAVNKMDKPTASKDRIMQQLTEYEIVPEEWGGKTIVVPVSAKTKEGINDLLESVLLCADIMELKANPNRSATGVIVEAELDKGKGPVATVLVKNGTLKVGDTIVSGVASGRIRAMIDDKGRQIKLAPPSTPVSVLGFDEVPVAGEQAFAVSDGLSKAVVAERIARQKELMVASQKKITLDEAFKNTAEGEQKVLNLIIKADVQGSLEAVKQSLLKLSNDEAVVKIIHGGVGAVNESDVMLASTSGAVIIAFNVRPDAKTKALAERYSIEVKTYRIIYDAINEITLALKGMLAPVFKEVVLGQIEVRDVFKISGVGAIAGGYVTDGKVTRNAKVRLIRQGNIIHDGQIASLKRFKDDVKEVAQGFECGIGIESYNDIKEGDVIEAYINEEVERA